jgi:cold shock CspA family protein
MTNGKVLRWFNDRSYGFLVASETVGVVHSGMEFFFRSDDLPPNTVPPRRGSRVVFEVGEGRNGKNKAVNVKVVAPPPYVRPTDIGAPAEGNADARS